MANIEAATPPPPIVMCKTPIHTACTSDLVGARSSLYSIHILYSIICHLNLKKIETSLQRYSLSGEQQMSSHSPTLCNTMHETTRPNTCLFCTPNLFTDTHHSISRSPIASVAPISSVIIHI